MREYKDFLRQPRADESDVYLWAGVSTLSVGLNLVSIPVAFIFVGFVLGGLAFLKAKEEGQNVPS